MRYREMREAGEIAKEIWKEQGMERIERERKMERDEGWRERDHERDMNGEIDRQRTASKASFCSIPIQHSSRRTFLTSR